MKASSLWQYKSPIFAAIMLFFGMLSFAGSPADIFSNTNLQFIKNNNQWDSSILYKATIHTSTIYVKKNELTYNQYSAKDINRIHDDTVNLFSQNTASVRAHAYNVRLLNASIHSTIEAKGKEDLYHNYFIGNDPLKWASKVPIYDEVIQKNVYHNIDWILHQENGNFKYDFVLYPGANSEDIEINYEGTDSIFLQNQRLYILTSIDSIFEERPIAYQIINNERVDITCTYILRQTRLSFAIGKYNKKYPLIIDPLVIMGTYSGATDQTIANCATFDSVNNMYSSGTAINGVYPVSLGAYRTTYAGIGDVVVSKYNASGTTQLFATYLGGYGRDMSSAILIDRSNRIVICGYTYAIDFPTTPGCIDAVYSGDTINRDAYVSILSNDGSTLLSSTFIGGSNDDEITDVKVDTLLNIYVCGSTNSTNFPVTPGTFDITYNGGYDAFLCKLNSNLTAVISGTFLGAANAENAYGLNLDPFNNIYVVGKTFSPLFPTTSSAVSRTYRGAGDAFITRFNNSLNLLASTYVASTFLDYAKFAIYDSAYVYVLGYTEGAFGRYPTCKTSSGFGGVFLSCYKPNLDSLVYRVPISNFDALTQITAFELSDSNYFLISCFLNLIRGTFPDSVFTTDSTYRSRLSLYVVAIAKNAEDVYYASFINYSFGAHIHGSSCSFNKKNNRLFHVICSRATERSTTTAPYRFCLTGGEYDMYSMIYQPNISRVINYRPSMYVNDTPYCSRSYVYLANTSIGLSSYKWILPNGQRDSTHRNINFYGVLDGMNIVKLIIYRNCSTIDTLTDTFFIPKRPSSIAVRLSDSVLCLNTTLVLTDRQLSGNRNYWKLPSGAIDSTSDTIRYFASTAGLISFYLISDSIQCPSRKDTVKVNFYVIDRPQSAILDIDTPVCAPFRDSLRQNSRNYTSHLWSDDFGRRDSINNSFYLQIDSALDYKIYLSTFNANCSLVSEDTFHFRSILPPQSIFTASTLYDCLPSSINFTQAALNYTSFYWLMNDSIVDSTHINLALNFERAGRYKIQLVTQSIYCLKTDTQELSVTIYPSPISIIDTLTTIGCAPFTTSLSNHSVNFGRSYWIKNDTIVDSSSLILSIANLPAGTYTYQLVIYGDSCISITDTSVVQLTVTALSQSIIDKNDTSACAPFSIIVHNLSSNYSNWQWGVDDSFLTSSDDSLSVLFAYPGLHSIQLFTSNILCPSFIDSSKIIVNIFDEPKAIALISPLVGCSPLVVNFNNQSTYSDSNIWIISTGTMNTNDSFTQIFTSPGAYHVYLCAFNSLCSSWDTAQFAINVLNIPKAIISCYDTALCIPDTATLSNSSTNYSRYTWTQPFADSTNNTINVSRSDSGLLLVELIVYGDDCPLLSDTAQQYVFFKSQSDIRLAVSDTVGCEKLEVDAYLSVKNASSRWTTDPFSSLLVDKDSVHYQFSTAGIHTIHIEIFDPICVETPRILNQNIHVYPQSKASFYYTPLYVIEDSFTNLISYSTQADSITWIIDQQYIVNNRDSLLLDSLVSGSHQICLITQNSYQCNDTNCQFIYVLKKPEIQSACTVMPVSAFTPNDDGINDRFYILLKSVENINLEVYNRWGEQVFQAKSAADFGLRNDF